MTAPGRPPVLDTGALVASEDEPSTPTRRQIQATVTQPNVRLLNGKEQTPFSITNRATGETTTFGNKLGERSFAGVQLVLTCDADRDLFWIIAIDTKNGALFQIGYLAKDVDAAFSMFVSGSPQEIRELMVNVPSN